MKKLIVLISIFTILAMFSTTSFAQHYVVFDGEEFSVMFKLNDDETTILEVSFTNNDRSAWVKFTIDDFEDLGDDGFIYYVTDGEGKEFTIDYYPYSDDIEVVN